MAVKNQHESKKIHLLVGAVSYALTGCAATKRLLSIPDPPAAAKSD